MRYMDIIRVSRHRNVISGGYNYDAKVSGCNKWTLFQAAKCGDIRQLDTCIDGNVDIGSKTSEGRTVLHIAVANRQFKFVKYLLHHHPYCISKGADLDLQGLNALHICVVTGDADIYCLLQEAGFDTGIETQDGKTVYDLAKGRHHNHLLGLIDIARNSEVEGYNYDAKVSGCNKWTLFQAAKCGDIRQLDKCVDGNVDIGSKNSEGRTALHIAVAHMQLKFVKYLLHHHPNCISKGADLDLQGLNALHICVVNGDAEIYLLLQKAGFDTGFTTQDGKTVYDLAKGRHHNHLLGLIDMARNSEVEDETLTTWTELHHCAVRGSSAECSRLIGFSHNDVDVAVDSSTHPYSDLQLPKHRQMTPIELAMHSDNISVLEILAKYSSFNSIERCLADSSSSAINGVLARGILNQLQEKHEDVQYGKLSGTGESVIVVYTSDDHLTGRRSKSAGIKTIYKNINGFDPDNERAIDFELDMTGAGLSREENALMQYVVEANSDTLWNNHENLNGIHISAVRTKGGKAFREECIVLCCKFKGFLQGNEEEFPSMLSCDGVSFPVDVREDHTVSLANHPSDKLEPLACGGRIQDNKVYGTTGPFVQLPNDETGFITCAHVLDNKPQFGVQCGHNHLVYQPTTEDSLCGEVVKMCFRPRAYPSIDAAIIRITSGLRVPRSTNFVAAELEAFQAAGIAEGLTFNTGAIGTYLPDSPLLKFGAFTPVLKCKCSAIGHEERITYPQGKVLMKGLSKMLCRVQHQKGDSGAGVFVENDEGKLECVGLFIAGSGRQGYFIPIKDVLKQCGNYQLKSFI